MRESAIEKKVTDYAKKQGWLTYKFSSPGKRSVPDQIFFKNNYTFFIEFKATGKKATPAQIREHKKLSKQGFVVFVIDGIQGGIDCVDSQ